MKKFYALLAALVIGFGAVSTASAVEWKWSDKLIEKFEKSYKYQIDFMIEGYDDYEQIVICSCYAVHIMPNGEVLFRNNNPDCTAEAAWETLNHYKVNLDSQWNIWGKNYQEEEHWF